ncbi:lytic transglycosylase domain-containing protein [Paucibacter sp. XJ19-41]|uniref:lytic transglycosylase domain-containing protein n=1 Tax=Paucibacter sp. XJ19-41 TaxID=2927824 RepID=UPI00234907AA|nr:lytic transglycosylase domain-containing protein [Paucibacter sp. XJ19-41]MDC6168812.1 lytic transglycosylase domain-containing protein [Paucibacter sp. XJ19-41]
MRRLAVVCLFWLSGTAQAELWGYVDGAGVAHLASRPLNSNYGLVLGSAEPDRRVPGKLDGSQGLLTWLEFAPEVKAVQPFLREAAARHGVDMELLKAVIAVESGYRHDAVSPRGAVGLMQIVAPAEQTQRLLDPRTNVLTGARKLAGLIQRFGRIDVALAAWNAGEGAVRRHGGGMPPFAETQAHVHLVLELYWALLQRSLPAQAQHLRIHSSPK